MILVLFMISLKGFILFDPDRTFYMKYDLLYMFLRSGAPLWICLSVSLYVWGLSVWVSVCLLHFFENLIFKNLYILQIYLWNMKSFSLKYTNFLILNTFKSRLCSHINLDFLQFYLISVKIYIYRILLKYRISYIFHMSSLFLINLFLLFYISIPLQWTIRPC